MKTLYFVGNEELWKDAWFVAFAESLKNRSTKVVLLDSEKDSADLKKAIQSLSAYDRLIFHKGIIPNDVYNEIGVSPANDKASLVYVFSDIINPNAEPKQISWACEKDDFLSTLGILDSSQILEDAFLFDMNVAGEVSKAIQAPSDTKVDADLLVADGKQIEKFIDDQALDSIDPLRDTNVHGSDGLSDDDIFSVHEEKSERIELAKTAISIEKNILMNSDEGAAASPKVESTSVEDPAEHPIKLAVPSVEVSQLLSSMSHSVSSEDIEVLKRYSNIKERELREAQASAEALRRQIKYFDERLKKSEEDRRKLLLKIEEVQNELRTVSDKKDENKVQIKSIENRYEEKIKELQIQLESAQFQAGKLDKKLTDFRERVRNDLQKIRSRERELASRLEIQKRDAEALLSAKDERLLNQKREMDRLEFEMDSLKERLIDDVHKTEDRKKRVSRALQSLKLAQSILSGLDEDIVNSDDKEKAA